jgi:hypothetical protein
LGAALTIFNVRGFFLLNDFVWKELIKAKNNVISPKLQDSYKNVCLEEILSEGQNTKIPQTKTNFHDPYVHTYIPVFLMKNSRLFFHTV